MWELLTASVIVAKKLWTPSLISTELWLDAQDASTITDSLGFVSQWDDKSGNGRNLTQATASQQPRTGVDTLNGRNTIKFDGQTDVMSTLSNPYSGGYSECSHFFVMNLNAKGQDTLCVFNTIPDVKVHCPWNNGAIFYDVDYPQRLGSVTDELVNGDNYIIELRNSIADNKQYMRKNGVELISNSVSSNLTLTDELFLGARDGVGWQSINSSVAEVVFTSNGILTLEERQKIEGYLSHQWGLEGNLDPLHPYKNNAPTI